ncbi:cupin domain-containing protein [Flavobacterium selenitireducens]|uniref:cupin domain-containing protein n=1 Tax=Flavobacterium selenitireducens TaxID=2722704 RepID=UPI00168B8280|nr:cupin domain-containing protein [Flavobacterium selenitireducens]MBD3581266.1 cupin domain-containing protein [Flavobacterium selenitireducens]
MKTNKNLILGLAFIAIGSFFAIDANAQHSGVTMTDRQRHDVNFPGHEAILARIDFEPGTHFGMHSRLGEEIICVIEGTLEYEIESGQPVTLKAAEVLLYPPGKITQNTGKVKAAELATYLVKKDKPLLVMKK